MRNDKAHYRWLFNQARALLGRHLLLATLLISSSIMFLLDPLLLKWLIDGILPKRDFHLLIVATLGFLGIFTCREALSAFAGNLSSRVVQELAFRMRLNVLEQLNRLSADYHETTPVGEKLYRIEGDVDQAAEIGSGLVPSALQTGFNAMFVTLTLFMLDFQLACILLFLLPIFLIVRRYFDGALHRASEGAQLQSGKESSFLLEHLTSIIQVQLLCQEGSQMQIFLLRATTKLNAVNRRNLTEILFRTCYLAVIGLSTLAVLAYGSYRVLIGALTLGGLVATYGYILMLFEPLHSAVQIYSRMKRLSVSIRRIRDIVEVAPTITERQGAVELPASTRGQIDMTDVWFSYPNGRPVLRNFNLSLRPGEKVALVGVSGSGKSTIAKLMARLYDPQQGTVYIDGTDVRSLRLRSVRARLCYVMQDAVLFDRSLRENLLMGDPSSTLDELWHAIKMVELEHLVERLPERLDTQLGPNGNILSGGERQRVALARAIMQRPSLLLLDEPTSALDSPSERRVLINLAKHFSNQTIVVVSHRITALTWVDRIIAVGEGMVEEQGSHDELVRQGGLYSHLYSASA